MSLKQKTGYLSLPLEIREMIMDLALNPGLVWIDLPSNRATVDRYGVQMLATCRQVYEEGFRVWYGKNIFRVPSCPFEVLKKLLGFYQHKHIKMIDSLEVYCSLGDIPEGVASSISKRVAKYYGRVSSTQYHIRSSLLQNRLEEEYIDAMKQAWREKALWLREEVRKDGRMDLAQSQGSETRTLYIGEMACHMGGASISLEIGSRVHHEISRDDLDWFIRKSYEQFSVTAFNSAAYAIWNGTGSLPE